jgi:hypothetical protein
MAAMDVYPFMLIKESEEDSLMAAQGVKEVISSLKHINLFTISPISGEKQYKVMMVEQVGLEEKMEKMEE